MNKTIAINLGGRNFIIEEAAQIKLQNYLAEIRKHCQIETDTEEVMADIELGMAEKLKATLTPYKEVITTDDINALIKVMGTVADFDREVGRTTVSEEESLNNETKTNRRLYRDTDNAILGGVAAGLGAYFDTDPIIFRIIFVALVFAGGSGFLVYLILWLITPAAKNAHQKLEMQGQAPTIAAFERLAEKTNSAWKKGIKNWRARSLFSKIINLPFLALRYLFLALKKVWSVLWPIIKFCFGLFLIVCSLFGLAAIGIGGLYLILQTNSIYRLSYIPVNELTEMIPFVWLVVSGALTLAIPAALTLIAGLVLIRKKTFMAFSAIVILVAIWMAAVISVSALSLRYFPELKEKVDNYPPLQKTEQAISVSEIKTLAVTGRHLQIMVESGATTTASVSGRAIDLEKVLTKNENGELNIKEAEENNDHLCFACGLETIVIKLSVPNLETIQASQADISIDKNFNHPLIIMADRYSHIELIETQIPALTVFAKDNAMIDISGQVASSSLSIKEATLRLNNFSGDSVDLHSAGQAYLTGTIKNLSLSSGLDCTRENDCELNAYQAQIGTVDFNISGSPIVILGPTDRTSGTVSDETIIFCKEMTKINKEIADKKIIRYRSLSEEEQYEISSEDPTSAQNIIRINGQYFSIDRPDWMVNGYQGLNNKFRYLIRQN
ncbi:MAG: PspC domain-containing protein [Patescibacteria group bacterium]